jgi:hypothetical protein
MFSDQLRLAFFKPSADKAVAAVSLSVWVVLLLELFFEAFIRPDGYRSLVVSDKAFAPATVRYISNFHLLIETMSLALYIPEFYCLFTNESCSQSYPFSLQNALLMTVIGPSRVDGFYGHAYIALIRFRVFGLVRHWRNMWIANTFINSKWKPGQGGLLSNVIPTQGSRTFQERNSMIEVKKTAQSSRQEQKKDNSLTNASTIGTALMVTNSYRALLLTWAITGLLPVFVSLASPNYNEIADQMTAQLQGTNLVASDTSNATCEYLEQSVTSWIFGVSNQYDRYDGPYLLNLDLKPYRCEFNNITPAHQQICEFWDTVDSLNSTDRETAYYCSVWTNASDVQSVASAYGIRSGSILVYEEEQLANLTGVFEDGLTMTIPVNYSVKTMFDLTWSVKVA